MHNIFFIICCVIMIAITAVNLLESDTDGDNGYQDDNFDDLEDFMTIEDQLSYQDPEGVRYFFTPDGMMHTLHPSRKDCINAVKITES